MPHSRCRLWRRDAVRRVHHCGSLAIADAILNLARVESILPASRGAERRKLNAGLESQGVQLMPRVLEESLRLMAPPDTELRVGDLLKPWRMVTDERGQQIAFAGKKSFRFTG